MQIPGSRPNRSQERFEFPLIRFSQGTWLSQLLTLFTTPVIYLAFDRLAGRFRAEASPALPGESTHS